VRPPDRASGGELLDPFGADVVTERTQSFDDAPSARLAGLAKAPQPGLDTLVERVEGVGEDVDVDPFVRA
jgi:hypothetical protein